MFKWTLLATVILNLGWASHPFQEGAALFQQKKYQEALALFQTAEPTDKEEFKMLFGQLFCHVALGHTDQIDASMELIDYKLRALTDCKNPPDTGPLTQEQQHMSYICRRHIREIAGQMRQTVEKLVRESVPGIFQKIKMLRHLYPFIDTLEQTGIECCQNNFPWACCMDPMLEQLQSWNSFGLSPN